MALISCPNCGKLYSEHADRCPSCGLTFSEAEEKALEDAKKKSEKMKAFRRSAKRASFAVIALAICIAVFCLMFKAIRYHKVNSRELYKVWIDGKCGFIDRTGKEIVPCKYDYADDFIDGIARVAYIDYGDDGVDSRSGIINKKGEEIIPCDYGFVENLSGGIAVKSSGGNRLYFDKSGKEITKYEYIDCFSEGLADVKINGKWGYINKRRKVVIPCKYDRTCSFNEGLACVNADEKWGYIDKTGREIVPCQYKDANDFSDGLARVWRENGACVYIDKKGEERFSYVYDDFEDYPLKFWEGIALVFLDDKCGYIDTTGREITPCKYDNVFLECHFGGTENSINEIDACQFHEGLALVCLNGLYGYIDKAGEEVIPCKYNDACYFSNGLARVETNGKWKYIDKTGKEAIPKPEKENEVVREDNHEKFTYVSRNGKWGYIDNTGKEITPFKYDGPEYGSWGYWFEP